MNYIKNLLVGAAATAAFAAPVAAGPALTKAVSAEDLADLAAVESVADSEFREVHRKLDELRPDLRPRPIPHPRSFATVVLFTNTRFSRAWVRCAAYDGNGVILGGARTLVPGNGVRFLRASDIANGRKYLGNVICKANGRVIGSVVLVGPGGELTDLRVTQRNGPTWTLLRFPLVASF